MKMRMAADAQEPARCCVSGCSCTRFRPGSIQIRSCDRCGHGWVAHASEKFQTHPPSSCGPVEVALPGLVFDLSSLVLYGAQAIPVQLKILLDRLYSILTPEQVGHILHTLGWSLGDYVRGYMLQHPSGKVLDRWFMVTPKEEQFILKQFLRFGETRAIVELMTLQFLETADHSFKAELKSVPKTCQSNVNKNGLSLLLPFDFSHSNLHCLVPPTRELVASSKLTQILQKASGKQMTESHKREGGRGGQVNDMVAQQSKFEPPSKIKNEPDKVNSPRSRWHQNPSFFNDQELYLQRGLIQQESTTSMSTSLNSSLIPSFSSSAHPMSNSSTSPLKISLKPQDSPSSSLHPLPSFSSSFLCPFRTSFSSSLHSLPSPLCSFSLSSSGGGRKGRVCCGVCGKSFYDKGTLKIHYNAVHLKIKHRCTVTGCTMVFSSLRSRNRHSANPNPRLHMGSSRDAHPHRNTHYVDSDAHIPDVKQTHEDIHDTRMRRERETSDSLWHQVDDAHATRKNSHTNHHGYRHNTTLQVDPSPQALSQDTNQIISLKTHPAPPPPRHQSSSSSPSCSPVVIPEQDPLTNNASSTSLLSNPAPFTMVSYRNQSVTRHFDVAEGSVCTSLLTSQWWPWQSADPVPKKKPRKSSMPVKIERQRLDSRRHNEEEC